jgi:hypothetical protein
MPSRTQLREQQKIKNIRISFAVYVVLLVALCVNLFLITEKNYITYEVVLVGLAYLFNLRLVLRGMNKGRSGEMSFYFLAHVVVAAGVVFLLVADKISSGDTSNFTNSVD